MAAKRRTENPLDPPSVRYAPLSELNVYAVYEYQLDALARGSSNSILLNFAVFLLPIAITLLVTLLTTTIPSDRLFLGFLSVAVITAIAGIVLLLLWWRNHREAEDLLRAIKARMPPPTSFQQGSDVPRPSRDTFPSTPKQLRTLPRERLGVRRKP